MSLMHSLVISFGFTADRRHLEYFSLRIRFLIELDWVADLRSCLRLGNLRPFKARTLVEDFYLHCLRRRGVVFELSVNNEVELFAFRMLD